MTFRIRWSFDATVSDDSSVSFARVLQVDAIDRIVKSLDAGESVTAQVQPSAAADVRLLVITATAYGADLTYRVGASTQDIALDAPHIFAGAGMIGRLPSAPNEFAFTNGLTDAVTVTVLVGRTA